MKTRVASVILDTHSQDIDEVDEESKKRDKSVADSAASFAEVTYSENISMYSERTGISLDARFGTSSAENSLYKKAMSEKMQSVDNVAYSQAGELHVLHGLNDELRTYWDNSMLRPTKSNNVTWMIDPDSVPGGSRDGDIHWNIPYQNNAYDFSRAVPTKKVKGQWQEVPFQKEFFGSEIYGGKIQGGKIIGVNFESQFRDGIGEAFFHVDEKGSLHAQNFNANINLQQDTATGHNPRWYSGGFAQNGQGFALENGIMQMKAWAHKTNGDTTDFGQQNYYAQTFLEPNGLKQRAYPENYTGFGDTEAGNLIARTDIRSGRIDINDSFSDETGVAIRPTYLRVGSYYEGSRNDYNNDKHGIIYSHFMNTNSLHVQGTGLTIDANGVSKTLVNWGGSRFGQSIQVDDFIHADHEIKTDWWLYAKDHVEAGQWLKAGHHIYSGGYVYAEGDLYSKTNLKTSGNVQASGNIDADGIVGSKVGIISNGTLLKSDLSLKKNIQKVDSEEILAKLNAINVVNYQYKDADSPQQSVYGAIIDDVNDEKKYYIPEELIIRKNKNMKNDAISLNNYIAYLNLGIQELSKQVSNLTFRLSKLERKG